MRSSSTLDDPPAALPHDAPGICVWPRAELSACPFAFGPSRFGGDDPWGRVCARDGFDGTNSDAEEVRGASEDAADDADTPDGSPERLL